MGQALQGADSFVPVDQDAGRVRRDHHDRQGLAVVRERGQDLPVFARRRRYLMADLRPPVRRGAPLMRPLLLPDSLSSRWARNRT